MWEQQSYHTPKMILINFVGKLTPQELHKKTGILVLMDLFTKALSICIYYNWTRILLEDLESCMLGSKVLVLHMYYVRQWTSVYVLTVETRIQLVSYSTLNNTHLASSPILGRQRTREMELTISAIILCYEAEHK